jgi:hypothetical protein
MLNAHPRIGIASDVFFPLFVSLRNASVVTSLNRVSWDATCSIQDYYFSDDRLQVLDCVQATPADIRIDSAGLARARDAMIQRAGHEAGDIVPTLRDLTGESYADVFLSGLRGIAHARQRQSLRWVGAKDVWTIEFVVPLMRIFDDARFIVVMRDPRAIVASMLKIAEADPAQAGHVVSYARHWRKYVAFIHHFRQIPDLNGRLFVLSYEGLVSNPGAEVHRLCEFLNIEFDQAMLRTDQYRRGDGRRWTGNSSFVKSINGFGKNRTTGGKATLDPRVEDVIELICGDDMRQLGMECPPNDLDAAARLESFQASYSNSASWRSDLCDLERDYGYELFRRALLNTAKVPDDGQVIRRSFLFEEVYDWLRTSSN